MEKRFQNVNQSLISGIRFIQNTGEGWRNKKSNLFLTCDNGRTNSEMGGAGAGLIGSSAEVGNSSPHTHSPCYLGSWVGQFRQARDLHGLAHFECHVGPGRG